MFFSIINKDCNKGFAAIFAVILVLVIMSGIGVALLNFVMGEQKILKNEVKGLQAYFAAEAGAEDILLRINKAMDWTALYSLNAGIASATVDVSSVIGGTRVITSTGNASNRIRKVQIIQEVTADSIAFHYGAQVGDGGMVMGNNSIVEGNIFSNGSVIGGGTIKNDLIVAGNGNKMEGVHVQGNAKAHTCKDSIVDGNLVYVSGGGIQNCTVGQSILMQPGEISPENLPISQSQIDQWKEPAAQDIIANDVTVSGIQILGPAQIGTLVQPKNLAVNNGATLKIYGTIYVTGNVTLYQGSIVQLESSYTSFSGMIIADGVITVENGVQLSGSGQAGSYILLLSTKNDTTSPVIDIRNNAAGAIFYSNAGLIYLKNGMIAREVTGFKVQIENNAQIQYESGLQSAAFTSGPGGSWKIASWQEVE